MTSKQRPEAAKNNGQRSTPGIRILPPRLDRPNPYGVEWAEKVWDEKTQTEVRKRKSEFFPTLEQCHARAGKLREQKRSGRLVTMNRNEMDDWRSFCHAIGATPWQNVIAAWKMHDRSVGSRVTVGEYVATYLERMKTRVDAGTLSPNWHGHQRHKLGMLGQSFGTVALNAVGTEDVRRWLGSHRLVTPGTYNAYRKICAAFFASAMEERIVSENPVERVPVMHDISDDAGILTVPQTAKILFRALTDDRYKICLRRLALEIFAGVRYSSACRLKADDIRTEDRGIRHPSRSIKTRKRQYIEGYPDVLWDWLKIAPDDSLLTERFYLRLKSQIFEVTGVPHPHNCFRHGFATYHLASRTNPGLTAYLLCHRNQGKLWAAYKGNATRVEGLQWEALTPSFVARWSESGFAPSADRPETSPVPKDESGMAVPPP